MNNCRYSVYFQCLKRPHSEYEEFARDDINSGEGGYHEE